MARRDKRIKQLEEEFAETQQQYTECYDEVWHCYLIIFYLYIPLTNLVLLVRIISYGPRFFLSDIVV